MPSIASKSVFNEFRKKTLLGSPVNSVSTFEGNLVSSAKKASNSTVQQ